MYVIEILKCDNTLYWYHDRVGEFFDIKPIYEDDTPNYINMTQRTYNIFGRQRFKLDANKTVDFNDVIIHNKRTLKLKKLLKCTS